MIYSAYTRVPDEFPTFEAAVDHLQTYPGSEGREPVAVLLLTDTNSLGAEAEQVDGTPAEPGESQVYLVTVAHEVLGKKFTFEYIVEFGAIPEREEIVDTEDGDDSEVGPGHEEGTEQPDEGTGEGSIRSEVGIDAEDEGGTPDNSLPRDSRQDPGGNAVYDSAE